MFNTQEISNKPQFADYEIFKKKVEPLINLDLNQYNSNQIERKISSFMIKNGLETLTELYKLLKKDREILLSFINMLTMNVSEFFRDKDNLLELKTSILPYLKSKFDGKLKIWSAECSLAAEIYTVAMILDKLNMLNSVDLHASDFNENILAKAKQGIYSTPEISALPPGYETYFTRIDEDKHKIASQIIQKVQFKNVNLLKDNFDNSYNLILFRNAFIDFSENVKKVIYKKFFDSLSPNGILFVASQEKISNYKQIGFTLKSQVFYEKL